MDERVSRFPLCRLCAKRQGTAVVFSPAEDRVCFICRGISANLGRLIDKILPRLGRYEFQTFSVGVILPQGVQEREDRIRSDFRMRGKETIKSELGGRIAGAIAKKMRKKVDRLHPDVTVLLRIERGIVETTSKPLLIYGRYTKPRGVEQRRFFCEQCDGSGCDKCGGSGYSSKPSVEEFIAKKFGRLLGSKKCKFTWYGSEDVNSVVFPPGRPFVVELKNPFRRRPPKKLRIRTGRGGILVSGITPLARRFNQPAFTFKTRVIMRAESPVGAKLTKLEREMKNALVQYRNNKGRLVYKKVYSVRVKGRGKEMVADIKLDGGLPVRRLVSGEDVSPSLSELLEVPLKCERFDILRVWPEPGSGPKVSGIASK